MSSAGNPHRRRLGPGTVVVLALLLVLVAGGAYLVAGYTVYDTLSAVSGECHPTDVDDTPQQFTVEDLDPAYLAGLAMPAPRDVEFRSRDAAIADLTLRAWWIPAADPAGPAVILVHGRASCRRDPNILLPAGMLFRAGYSVLLMDQRDHGDSDDEDLRFAAGSEEFADVLGAWDWVVAQGVPQDRIGLLGMSFGAATVLIAGGEEPRVRAVWEDSSYADLHDAIRNYLTDEGYPALLEPAAGIVARLASGDDLFAHSPLAAIPAFRGRHLAIAHGDADTTSLPAFAADLRDAALANGVLLDDYWIAAGMGHTRAIIELPDAYEPRLLAFFRGAIGEP